jgi:hypothetical protein
MGAKNASAIYADRGAAVGRLGQRFSQWLAATTEAAVC